MLQNHKRQSWNKGRIPTKKQNQARSRTLLGHPVSEETRKKIGRAKRGSKHSEESKQKMRISSLGQNAWNKELTKATDERVAKYAMAQTGRVASDQTKQKQRLAKLGKPLSKEHREKIGKANLGRICSSKTRYKIGQANSKHWQDPEFAKRQAEIRNLKPNNTEKILNSVLNQYFPLQWKYVGDWSVFINGRNPDFIHKEKHKIIEMFGCYYHKCPQCFPNITEPSDYYLRKMHFEKSGYHALIIWAHELKQIESVIQKVQTFLETT